MSHTPGPWINGNSDLNVSTLSVHGYDGKQKHSTICKLVSSEHGMSIDEIISNANLISAAPELLSQLKFAIKLLNQVPYMSKSAQVNSMKIVVNKAER